MLQNYLKITLRNLRKQKLYAVINVVGLAVGIAFCALIFLYVRDELTYDRFHKQAERIYRAHRISFEADGSVRQYDTSLPLPAGPALKEDLPEVEQVVRFFRSDHFVRRGEVAFEESVLYTDPHVFEVFTFPLRQGDPATALTGTDGVVLSEAAARKYFGDADALGERLSVRIGQQYFDFTVTGVAESVPENSSLRFDLLLPLPKLVETVDYFRERADSWHSSAFKTYVLLDRPIMPEAMAPKLAAFRKKHYPDEEAELRARGLWAGEGMPATYGFQPLTEIHLNPEISGLEPTSSSTYSYILLGIALAVLLIACINFTTLAIGRSSGRAREVGVRKVVGATRRQLMAQFWGEAMLLSVLALVLGAALAELFLPAFNDLAGKTLHFRSEEIGATAALLLGVTLVTGFVAGLYPALVLSRFRPVEALKSRLRLGGANAFTRSLVVVQFALSIFLISSTFIMLGQLDYVRSKGLGFEAEQMVVVETQGADAAQVLDRFRNELGARPEIRGITGTSSAFGGPVSRMGFEYQGELVQVVEYVVESDFLDVMGVKLAEGRAFDPRLATDSSRTVLVNETLVRDFGWAEALGQPLTGLTEDPSTAPVVVGVVEDFNFRSLHHAVEPMMFTLGPRRSLRTVLVRLAPGDVPATLSLLRSTWADVAPDVPFQYSFLDDDLDRQYRAEERWSRIVGYASFFAVLIACLGLFGLAMLTVAGRTKEIGIRKVMGAPLSGLAGLLSKEYVKLVLVAMVFAAPAAFFAMRAWLDGFAYRIEIGPGVFLLTGALALVVALLTVGYHTVQAALADPVEALRYE